MAKQTEAESSPSDRLDPDSAESSRRAELPSDWLDQLKAAMVDNDYDSFLSLTADSPRWQPDQLEEVRRRRALAAILFETRRTADRLGQQLLDRDYDSGLGHRYRFVSRITTDGVELLDVGRQSQVANRLIESAKDWQSVPEFGAIDGHTLAILASWGLLSNRQAADLARLACSDDEVIAGREVLIDRLLRACTFPDELLEEMLQRCQADYSFEAAYYLPPAEREHWPSLMSLVRGEYQKKQGALKKSSESTGAESSDQEVEIDRLATELKLTDSGRQILLDTRPVIHDLGSPEMSLGFDPDPDLIDGFGLLPPRDQFCLLGQINQDINPRVLANLSLLSRAGGWYESYEHRINFVASHFVDKSSTWAHELIHAAESSLSLDDLHRLYRAAAIYAQTNPPVLDGADYGPTFLSGRIPVDVAVAVASSSRKSDLLFDGGGGQRPAQFVQNAHRLLPLEDDLRVPPGRPIQTASFLTEIIASAGTEIVDLPPDLEDYYRLIFRDRRGLVKVFRHRREMSFREAFGRAGPTRLVRSMSFRFWDVRDGVRAVRDKKLDNADETSCHLAIRELTERCHQLSQLAREANRLIVDPPEGRHNPAHLRQIANEAQINLRQSLEYIYDINCLIHPLAEAA